MLQGFTLITVLLYAVAIALQFRAWPKWLLFLFWLLPLLSHGCLLGLDWQQHGGWDVSLGPTLSLQAWLLWFLAGLTGLWQRLRLLRLPLGAMALLSVALVPWLPQSHGLSTEHAWALVWHVSTSLLGYGLMALAAWVALALCWSERRLHAQPGHPWLAWFPAVLTLESQLFLVLGLGFVALTLGLASGVIYTHLSLGRWWVLNHKTLFSDLAWLSYAWLLAARWGLGLRGCRAARWTLVSFGLLFLGFIGTKLVLTLILHR